MNFSIDPAYFFANETLRLLTKESVKRENQWFFLEGSFNKFKTVLFNCDTWLNETFIVVKEKKIIAYFEAEWMRPLNVIHNFRVIFFDKKNSFAATKALFIFLEYLFFNRGCDVLNWSVATQNIHAFEIYEKFIKKECGHKAAKT